MALETQYRLESYLPQALRSLSPPVCHGTRCWKVGLVVPEHRQKASLLALRTVTTATPTRQGRAAPGSPLNTAYSRRLLLGLGVDGEAEPWGTGHSAREGEGRGWN